MTIETVKPYDDPMPAALQVIQSTAHAECLLKPDRLRILQQLDEPDSASGVARKLEMPRQTVNYHLRELEKAGFVEFVEQRPKGNCLERVVRATARSYVISPIALQSLGRSAATTRDQFSTAYLVAAAARAIRDVSILRGRAAKAGKRVATLTLESEIRFASAQARREFTEQLLQAVAALAAKYHDAETEGGRAFRLMIGAYPVITKQEPSDDASVPMD